MYKEVNKKAFPKIEEDILSFWESEGLDAKTLTKGTKEYVFYDGPPGTNGSPHIGHMLQSALKDLWPRYKTMQGYKVVRKAGWDTHGLPIELAAEKELGLSSKKDIEAYGLNNFVEHCKKTVYKYKGEWIEAIKRIGRVLDFEDEYATLTNEFIQSDWWVLKEAWDRELLYKGYKVLAYCPRLGTSLSNHEVALGYKEVTDISVYAKFAIKEQKNTYFIAWTTTLWTLIGNVALALGENITYVKINVDSEYYILSEDSLAKIKDKGLIKDFEVVEKFIGKELAGLSYIPLWDYFEGVEGKKHYTIIDDYVTTEEGSGIVHLALYGEDDYRLIKANNLPFVQHVDETGRFTKECTNYKGRMFDDEKLSIDIIKDLAGKNLILAKEKITHNYPFNYRTGTRLMYFAKSSWFLKTTEYKDKMISANQKINWYPSHIKDGRFGRWLFNNVDWAISRDRYWGSPIPIWNCLNCKKEILISSIDQLNKYTKEHIDKDFDLHIPYIDELKLYCPKCSNIMKRELGVLDCWFNSGVVPWGQIGYPSKEGSKEALKQLYPAEFICEGIDQTRGWFYALLAISALINGDSSYQNVICTELVLDKEGNKMSKSKGNTVDPNEMFKKYGADAMRWFFLNTKPGNPLRFSEDSIKESIKDIILPLWNIYSFYVTYAKIDKYVGKAEVSEKLDNALDKWILSENAKLIKEVQSCLDIYDSAGATNVITNYIDKLSNWYIRRSRRRFWKSEKDRNKQAAYATLYNVLVDLIKVLAPFMPFITEEIYQNIVRSVDKKSEISIHLCKYPKADESARNKEIEHRMNLVRRVVGHGRALRNKHQIKIRQPLKKLIIVAEQEKDKEIIKSMHEEIKEELNVKLLEFKTNQDELLDYVIKPNLKVLGKRFGKDLQSIIKQLTNINPTSVNGQNDSLEIKLRLNGKEVVLKEDELIIEKKAKAGLLIEVSDELTIVLDTNLNDELIKEGLAREFVNKVQNMRKENELEVLDKININFYASEAILQKSILEYEDYIKNETLAEHISFNKDKLKSESKKEWDLNNVKTKISIIKI